MKKLVITMLFLFLIDFAAAEGCNASISIDSNAEDFDNGEKIEFSIKLTTKEFDFIVEYWIENSDGKIIKQKINTTNTNKKSFTPKNLDSDIIIRARIAYLACPGINFGKNIAEKMIIFRKNIQTIQQNLANKTIKITFEVEKDTSKLQNLAKQLNNNGQLAQNPKTSVQTPKNTQQKSQSENKTRKLIPYFIITLTTLLSIVLVWRR